MKSDLEIKGRIHSVESCGTVDGPGVRFVIFTQGCPLRCQYCHNPDTRSISDGTLISVSDLIKDIEKVRSYIETTGGGITISGGEPLMQPIFVEALLKACKQSNFHTAIDTSGYTHLTHIKTLLSYTDLVLLDVKSFNPTTYKTITQVDLEPTLAFLQYLHKINKPTWIRYVLVPQLTDHLNDIDALAGYLKTLKNIDKIEILPFHKQGEYKWEQLGLPYQLKDTTEPTLQQIQEVSDIFSRAGLSVVV